MVTVQDGKIVIAGHSLEGTTNHYFLIRMDLEGVVEHNLKIATDSSKVPTDSVITTLRTNSATEMIVVFNSPTKEVVAKVTVDSSPTETYLVLNRGANAAILHAKEHSATSLTMLAIFDSKLVNIYANLATPSNTKAQYADSSLSFYPDPGRYDIDWMTSDSDAIFGVASTDGKLYHGKISFSSQNYASISMVHYYGKTAGAATHVSIVQIASDYAFLATIHSDGSAWIYKQWYVAGTSTAKIQVKPLNYGFTNWKIAAGYASGQFVYAASMKGAESASLTSDQVAIFKKAGSNLDSASFC